MRKSCSIVIVFALQWLAPHQAIQQAYAQLPGELARPVAQPQMPDADRMMILIRTTLIALSHANLTGNYSVLRDVGAPGFQQANNPARLAEVFADLRSRGIDLRPTSILAASLTQEPVINEHGMLRLTGFFPTRPEEVSFDLIFELVQGQWRLFGIGVGTSPADRAAAERAPSPPRQAQPVAAQDQAQEAAGPPPALSPVQEGQILLARLGYSPGPADGLAGPATRQAVRAFQRDAGMEETGEITPALLERLKAAAR